MKNIIILVFLVFSLDSFASMSETKENFFEIREGISINFPVGSTVYFVASGEEGLIYFQVVSTFERVGSYSIHEDYLLNSELMAPLLSAFESNRGIILAGDSSVGF